MVCFIFRDTVVHSKVASPKSIRVLTSSIRNKLRRRSEDEDSGVGTCDGDRPQAFGLGSGKRYLP